MPTSAPVVVAIGDIQQATLTVHDGDILSVCLQAGGNTISIHREGDAIESLQPLPFGGSKGKIAAAVLGDILCLAWDAGQEILFARWNLLDDSVDLAPQTAFPGSRPTLQSFQNSRLLLQYISPGNKNEYRTSLDSGASWTAANQLHANDVTDVDVDVSPNDTNNAVWVETDV